MVFCRFHNRKPVPPRDPVCDPIGEALSMEQIVKAYLNGNPMNIPEPDLGDYEFEPIDLLSGEIVHDISREELRDALPITLSIHDAAVRNTEQFKSATDVANPSDPEPAPAESVANEE